MLSFAIVYFSESGLFNRVTGDSNKKIRRCFQLAFEVVFETALSHALHRLALARPDRSASANGMARYSVFANQYL
jgi:hypothetical protein